MQVSSAQFEKLALEQMDTLYRVARRLTRDATRAEDLVQETYLRAIRAKAGFDLQEYGIRPWLLRIMHNLYVTTAQREGRQPVAAEDGVLESAGGSNDDLPPIAWRSFERMDQRLVQALEALPGEYANVITLWALEDLSYKEIADVLEVPIGTVMSRLHRARQRLANQLKDYAVRERLIRE